MKIKEVANREESKDFINVAKRIYRNDTTWVCPLDKDIDSIFDAQKNACYSHGEATRWILKDADNNLIGRVAAFIDHKSANNNEQPTGGMGFFECINNREAAILLFDTARRWLKERGMEAMDGPINFGETDKYWGLLVDGFTHPSFEVAYNHPYYRELFESYGFQIYYKMEGLHLDLKKELPSRFMKIAEWITKKPDYEFKHFEWRKQDKYINDFTEVFNEAWASFKIDFEPIKPEYIQKTLKKAKIIIDEEFIWFAYFKGKPIAIYMMYPDVNMIFKRLNGKMTLVNMIRFIILKKQKAMTRIKGLLMGVIPSFQGRGIESGFILNVLKVVERKPHYEEIEFSWVADFNPKMRKIFTAVGAVPAKHYITYRYLFDREAEFKRYPIPGV